MTILGALLIVLALAVDAGAQPLTVGGALTMGGSPSTPVTAPPVCSVQTNVTQISMPGTFLGFNRLAMAIVGYNSSSGSAISGVSTVLQNYALFGLVRQGNLEVAVWRLVAPTPGTDTVKVQFSAQVSVASLCLLALEGINQTTPLRNAQQASGTSTPAALSTTSAAGNIVMTAFASANNFITSSDDTVLVNSNPASALVKRIGFKPGAANVTITYGLSAVAAWNALIFDVVKN